MFDDPMFEDDAANASAQKALRDRLNALLGLSPVPAADPQADLAGLMAMLRGSAPADAAAEPSPVQPKYEDDETVLVGQDALREKLNALLAPAIDPQADRDNLMAILRGSVAPEVPDVTNAPEPPPPTRDDFSRLGPPPPAPAPAARDANPLYDKLTDSAYRRVMDEYADLMRKRRIEPGDSYVVQPTDDDGNPIFGEDLHFDTRTGRATLTPSTLPAARDRTPMEILKDYLNRDYFAPFKPPPRPLPPTGSGPRLRGDAAPVDPSHVFAALMRQGRR